jgi:competence protein ComEC
MALLVVVARSAGRVYDILKALLVAGFCMILHSPYILIFDPSFQLSFVATLGLILAGPLFERRLQFVPSALGIREFTVATVATQLFVLPLLLYQSGQLSLVSLLANLLVLIAVPYAMLTGFLAGFFGWIHTALAYPFALIAQILLSYILLVADVLERIPHASILVPSLSLWVVALLYVCMASVIYRLYRS